MKTDSFSFHVDSPHILTLAIERSPWESDLH